MSSIEIEVPKEPKDSTKKYKISLPKLILPHKISAIVFFLLLAVTTSLIIHSCLQIEHKQEIWKHFLELSLVENLYLIVIPSLVTSIVMLLFMIFPQNFIPHKNLHPFYKIMTYGCRNLLLSNIIMVIIPFVLVYIAICAHWTILFEILIDTKGDLQQIVTQIEEIEFYVLLVLETLMFFYIPKIAIMLVAKVHFRQILKTKENETFYGFWENFKALAEVCTLQQGTAILSSVLIPYHSMKNICTCKGEAEISDKALIQATVNRVTLRDGGMMASKRKEQLDPDTFRNVDLFIFLLAVINMTISTAIYMLLVTIDPLFVIFELLIALELSNELLIFVSTVSYVKLLNE